MNPVGWVELAKPIMFRIAQPCKMKMQRLAEVRKARGLLKGLGREHQALQSILSRAHAALRSGTACSPLQQKRGHE